MIKNVFIYEGNEKRLSKAVSEKLGYSFSYVQKLIRSRDIRVNGKKVASDDNVVGGDEITVFCIEEGARELDTVYEDDNLAVYHKGVKMPSEGENSLLSLLPNSFILCHRLDTNTEGLIILAKNEKTFDAVVDAIKKGYIEKYYTAVVIGKLKKDGMISGYLVKDSDKGIVYVDKKGNEEDKINTPYKIIKSYEDKTVVKVLLERGKTHQIRASFSSINHPIIGDGKYGTNEINRKYGAKTQWLCATELIFKFPDNSEYKYLNSIKFKINPKTFSL